MKKIIAPIFVIVASVTLIIVNIFTSDEFDKGFWMRNVSSLLLIFAMVFTIISIRKSNNKHEV